MCLVVSAVKAVEVFFLPRGEQTVQGDREGFPQEVYYPTLAGCMGHATRLPTGERCTWARHPRS